MPDYREIPRQRGTSETPMYETNPRKFARTRCEKAINACDRIILYMGELIQTYAPDGMLPTDAMNKALEFGEFANANEISLDQLIELSQLSENPELPLGKFTGYLVAASMIMQSAKSLQTVITELRSSI